MIATFGLIGALSVSAPAVQAQDAPPVSGQDVPNDGFSLMEEGAKILLRGLLEEMEPALDNLGDLAQEMGPAMEELRGMIGDFSAYELPEVLPNGDIIIRRKTPLENVDPSETEI